jgi:outer membrane protein assembly factor BamB
VSRRPTTRALALAAATALLLTAGCGGPDAPGSGKDAGKPAAPAGPDLPKDVQTIGEMTKPAMQPLWLVRSTGTEDSTKYEAESQGLLLDEDVAVYYTNDAILGLSTKDGKEVWKNPVDLGGELISAAARTITKKHHWTFTYASTGEELGDRAVTVDVRDGSVVADVAISRVGFGDVTGLVTADDVVYVGTGDGIYRVDPESGQLEQITSKADLGNQKVGMVDLAPIKGTTIAVASTSRKYVSADRIVGIDLTTGKALWQRPLAPFADSPKYTYLAGANQYDARWVVARDIRKAGETYLRITTLDPQTGRTVAQSRMPYYLMVDGARHLLQLQDDDTFQSGNNQAIQPVGDDILLQDDTSITLVDPQAGKALWSADTTNMRYAAGLDPESALGPISADGKYAYATVTTGVAGDVIAVDLANGKIAGRWALDPEQAAGLLQKPLIAVDGTRLVLGRNQAPDGSLTDYEDKTEKPLGALNDVGLFRFPDLE